MIPDQLQSDQPTFLRLAAESKAPIQGNSASDGPFFSRDDSGLIRHLGSGGNVARVLKDDLIAFDIDHAEFLEIVTEELGSSFTVESGGRGFGKHRYYRCSEWSGHHSQFTVDKTDYGSLRNGNSYCVVPPSKHDETGDEYRTDSDCQIQSVSVSDVESVVQEVANTTAGGGRRGGGVGSSNRQGTSAGIPSDYPSEQAGWNQCESILDRNDLLSRLNQTASSDWSGDEFVLCKCLAENGIAPESIIETLSRLDHRAKWHNGGDRLSVSEYRSLTVQKAIEEACSDPYVEFGNGDMGASEASESRKTESGDGNRTTIGGENMTEFTEKERAQVKEGSSDGDRAIEAVKVEGQDGQDKFDFVSVRKGRVRTVELTDGSEGQMIDVDETNGKSVGGTADLDLVIKALTELRDELE